MSEDAEQTFLKEGLKRYPEAMATIELFQRSMQEQLSSYVSEYENDLLQVTDKEPEPGEGNSRGSRRISVCKEARARDGKTLVWIEIGLWWEKSTVALFASLWSEADKRVKLANPRKHGSVQPQMFGSNKWRLFLPVATDADLGTACKVLLDELATAQ